MSKESVVLVSFKLQGDDPLASLSGVLADIKHPDILEIEVLDAEDFNEMIDDDEYDYFDNLMGEV